MIDETPTIERVLQGDTESFRLLVEQRGKSVLRLIERISVSAWAKVATLAIASLMGLGRVLLTLHLLLSL